MGSITSRAILFHEHGGPDVLRLQQIEVGDPAPDEVQVRHTAIGLNYVDVYDRSGLYPTELPSGLGREAAGVVQAVGRKVRDVRVGDRVAYISTRPGTYCDVRNVPQQYVVKIPRGVSDNEAAALMLKGLTAHTLLRRVYRVKAGETILVHAAAGGVGMILCQWAKSLGVRVIGVVGSEEKAKIAAKHGCRHVIVANRDSLVSSVKQLTRGTGVHVVYDSVGKDTFWESLDCLRPLGMMVTYGNASGPPPAVSPLELTKRGSLYLTRPSFFHFVSTREEMVRASRELFSAFKRKAFRVRIGQTYSLADAAEAHQDLEARRTTGSTVLIP
ncbi:MAG TPA: quinone oxidoreductase [Steroidobacteraceae bacterium]